ncbi:3662_t:CDS:10 [Dentiscutata heterogama]|uniref:3662_t:CDS:1 n=1 Tax=Dentiscutata heterogama TaxID=1316150 RepID=A0ACA9MCZ7_9GLOM|nr:3662_t:CDS:10 [Dentiscutata heterogama]
MFSTDSSENSKVVPFRATNCVENTKNTNGPLSCHHNIPPPQLYSSNTTMLSFNNVEQSYSRVVGQVYSRETVTTIYGDPTSSNCWNQRQVGFYCYVCQSIINPQDFHSWVSCASTNCDVYAHGGCLMKNGFHDRNGSWYCPRCISATHQSFSAPVRSMEQITSNSVENNPSPPINPLHLLLEASDQIQSNSGPDNNISVNTPVIHRETTSSQYSDVNNNSSHTDFMSCDPVPDQRLLNYNTNIDLMCANERNNVIRNLERTRMRQDKVSDALNDSLNRLTDEFNKHLKNNHNLREDNNKLNNALQKLKLALIPLAQERPVLQVLRKITQNDNLQSQDITTDNVLNLFMGLLPQSTVSNLFGTSLSNHLGTSSSSSTIQSSSSPSLDSCQKCSNFGENLIRCYYCQKVQHVECCSKDEKSSIDTMNERWTCVDCKDSSMAKRKHYSDKKSNSNGPSLTLIGNYKRIKTNDKNSLKDNSSLYSISTHNLDNSGVLSPQLTPQQLKSTNGGTQNNVDDMVERYAMPHTPMSDDDKITSDDNDSSFSSDLEIDDESHKDNSTPGTFDRTPPPDNGPEASRQPARFDGDMYTPRWVRGVGKSKEGLCPHCEPARWLKTKISAYWYHLNYQHGISSITGRPFAQPIAERLNKKSGMKEALCHKCNKWILNQSPRDKDVLVPEIYWYKHAQKCHHTP